MFDGPMMMAVMVMDDDDDTHGSGDECDDCDENEYCSDSDEVDDDFLLAVSRHGGYPYFDG